MHAAIIILAILLASALAVAFFYASATATLRVRIDKLEQEVARSHSALSGCNREIGALREKKDWFRGLFQASLSMVFVFRVEPDGMPGPFLEVNDAACSRLKHQHFELLKMGLPDIEYVETPGIGLGYKRSELAVLSDDYIRERQQKFAMSGFRALTKHVLATGDVTEEKEFQDANGERFPVIVHARAMDMGSAPCIILTVVDVTDRINVEKQLSESEKRFQRFFSESQNGMAVYDNQRQCIDVNLACLRIFGVPGKAEFRRFAMFDNPSIPENLKSEIAVGHDVHFETEFDFDKFAVPSHLITTRRGQAFLDVLIHKFDQHKDLRQHAYFVQIQDRTKRRQAERELRQRENELLQAERMGTIGAMAGSIAHDFKNILTPILGFAGLIKQKAGKEDDIPQYADRIEQAAHRAEGLVSRILTFSRAEKYDHESFRPTHVIPVLDEILNLQQSNQPHNIRIEKTIKTSNDTVMASSILLHRILLNLCTNAVHAMQPKGGTLSVRLQDIHIKYVPRHKTSELPRGHCLRLSIGDTGCGIDAETLEHIFDPFFTTKPKGKGTGMGLSMVRETVKQMKGSVTVESEPGKGTTFHITLPLVQTQARKPASVPTVSQPEDEQKRILVLDDDTAVLNLIATLLKALGYAAVTKSSPHAALELLKRDTKPLDAAIVDQSMPDMSGIEFINEAHKVRKDLPVILCSGRPPDLGPLAGSANLVTYLEKPVAPAALQSKLQQLLNPNRD